MSEQMLSDGELLSRFLSGAEKLHALVQGLSEEDLDLSPRPNAWSIRQIVHHLADDGDVWSMCIKKAIATPGALVRFEGFPGNESWASALDFGAREIGPALNLIRAHRQYLAQLLKHFSDVWNRTVRLANAKGEVVREMSVREMVKMLADHMLGHIEKIDAILAEREQDR
ncbi:MAG TPA: hypothetical protein EYH29_00715 [Caldilineales bacterium]|nr:hypothetical protein [Caldilineales bacterium]